MNREEPKAEPVCYLKEEWLHYEQSAEGQPGAFPVYAAPPDLAAEVERLHQVCRDAYEVWTGSEGIPEPVTCAEAYLYKLLIQMRDEVKKGLK